MANDVLAELVRFQNEDGGFGRGLEPDFRLGASSALATTVAFQVLRELGATSEDATVGSGIAYFLSCFDTEKRKWPSTPKELNDEPHAPWWRHDGDLGNAIDRSGWGNPAPRWWHAFESTHPLCRANFSTRLLTWPWTTSVPFRTRSTSTPCCATSG